jgi:hypothetical protein
MGILFGSIAYFYFDGERTRLWFKHRFSKWFSLHKEQKVKKDETK